MKYVFSVKLEHNLFEVPYERYDGARYPSRCCSFACNLLSLTLTNVVGTNFTTTTLYCYKFGSRKVVRHMTLTYNERVVYYRQSINIQFVAQFARY